MTCGGDSSFPGGVDVHPVGVATENVDDSQLRRLRQELGGDSPAAGENRSRVFEEGTEIVLLGVGTGEGGRGKNIAKELFNFGAIGSTATIRKPSGRRNAGDGIVL